jgi:hypothetical protein
VPPHTWWMGHADLFSKIAFELLPKESNAPIPANRRSGADIEDPGHDKESLQGLFQLKFKASLTFHKTSVYAVFENRPPCPCFDCLTIEGEGTGLFERTHLPDKTPLPVLRPESWSAWQWSNGIQILLLQQATGRAACTVGADAGLRRVPCRAV